MEPERNPILVSDKVLKICQGLDVTESFLSEWVAEAFVWATAATDHPDMTAEEIASMAADGFEVADEQPGKLRD